MDREEMLERLLKGEEPLEVSIKKWEDIVNGKAEFESGDNAINCALCEVNNGCSECVISKRSGYGMCDGTPFEEYVFLLGRKEDGEEITNEELIEAAKEELEFLISLRKKNKV